MKNGRKSAAYSYICEHFEEIFHQNLAVSGRFHEDLHSYPKKRAQLMCAQIDNATLAHFYLAALSAAITLSVTSKDGLL
jgi:hypothetical protein